MAPHCSAVLPGAYTASATGWRSERWWSTRAKPRSAHGSRRSSATAASGCTAPDRTSSSSARSAFSSTGTSSPLVRWLTMNPGQRIGYLGPAGTFTEQALLTQKDLSELELVDFSTIPGVLAATESGDV